MKIRFLGAAQTVTGSRYLVTVGSLRVLVDCGLFQGYKTLRLKNWDRFPIEPSEIDAVILSHAHLDHSGYLPRLCKDGFKGPIYCTEATKELCRILLPDSGYLQEEEARFANKRGYSKHKPALPLYTEEEAERTLDRFESVAWKTENKLSSKDGDNSIEFSFHPAGHILGAASISIRAKENTILFSGDLGRISDPLTRLPDCTVSADTLIVESTYGNRKHLANDVKNDIRSIVLRTIKRGGTLLIPSFAVGRAQLLLHYIHELKLEQSIPDVPVYLNSPMAIRANEVFLHCANESKVSLEHARAICDTAKAVSSVEDSILLNENSEPKIIIAASGMATGGRVLHHLKSLVPDPKNTVLFAGFQAGGTRGDSMLHGATEIKIHGEYWPVRAEILQLDSLSAHADGGEIINWIQKLPNVPKRIFVTHGEPAAADELRRRLCEKFRTSAHVPEFNDSFEI